MTVVDNKWFAQYCNLCAANVLNKQGEIRFTQKDLSDRNGIVPQSVLELHRNIMTACNKQFGTAYNANNETGEILLTTLINIHTSYLQINGVWEETEQGEGGEDEYGFEIF